MAHPSSAILPSDTVRRAPSPPAGLRAGTDATADQAAPALSVSHHDIASALRRLNRSAVFRLRRQWRLRGAGRGTLAGAIIRALEADGLIAQHPVHPHGRILSPAGMSALQRLFRF